MHTWLGGCLIVLTYSPWSIEARIREAQSGNEVPILPGVLLRSPKAWRMLAHSPITYLVLVHTSKTMMSSIYNRESPDTDPSHANTEKRYFPFKLRAQDFEVEIPHPTVILDVQNIMEA